MLEQVMQLWTMYGLEGLIILAKILIITLPLLICVAYLTYAERRVIGLMQLRKGPNVVGPMGLLQPFADALKLLTKETIIPEHASTITFIIAPIVTFTLSLIAWAVIPFGEDLVLSNLNVGYYTYLLFHPLGCMALLCRDGLVTLAMRF